MWKYILEYIAADSWTQLITSYAVTTDTCNRTCTFKSEEDHWNFLHKRKRYFVVGLHQKAKYPKAVVTDEYNLCDDAPEAAQNSAAGPGMVLASSQTNLTN